MALTAVELIELLLKHGSWFITAIEFDPFDTDIDGEALRVEAERIVNEAQGTTTPPPDTDS
jgi:hypothetical protein